MPFDEEEDESPIINKTGLKQVSSQKSIFENMPKKVNKEDFNNKVNEIEKSNSSYIKESSKLALEFKKILLDKTLEQNKTVFSIEIEKELIKNMITLASKINNDSNEDEGIGSIMWISLLLKSLFIQRNKINDLEYELISLKRDIEKNYVKIDKKPNHG